MSDPDGIDGRTPMGWLILTGIGIVAGTGPYSLIKGLSIIGMREVPLEGLAYLELTLGPLLTGVVPAAVGATVVVGLGRAGRPLGLVPLVVVYAVLGVATAAAIVGGASPWLAAGAASGLVAAFGVHLVRLRALYGV